MDSSYNYGLNGGDVFHLIYCLGIDIPANGTLFPKDRSGRPSGQVLT